MSRRRGRTVAPTPSTVYTAAAAVLLLSLPANAHLRSGVAGVDAAPLMAQVALTYSVPFAANPVVVDGDDGDWGDRAMQLDGSNRAYGDWDGDGDLSADLRLAWDRTQLYFLARVRDDELSPADPLAARRWQGDGVQFAFDGLLNASQEMNGGRRYDDLSFGLVESPDGPRLVLYPWSGAPRVLDVELAVRRDPDRRVYEWAIPWSRLAPLSPEFLGQTGFGFSLRDADAGDDASALAWTTGTIDGQRRPRYGRLVFEPPPEPAASFLALPPEWNVVDRGSRFLHLPGIDANGTAVLLVRSPTPRLVTGAIRVLDGPDTVRTGHQIGRIRSRPLALVWDLTRLMSGVADGSYTLEYQVTVPELEPVRVPLHYSKRLAGYPATASGGPPAAPGHGPIAHWSFDDCTPEDVTGNGHDGVAFGDPACVEGRFGRALRFDPEALSYMLVDRDIRLPEDYTLSAWVRLEDSEHVSWQFALSRMERATALRDGAWGLRFSRSRVFFLRRFFCCVEDDRWTMVTATGVGARGRLFVDGQQVLEGELTRVPNLDDLPVCIGCSQGNTLPPFQYFKGALDEVRIYGRALNPAEVETLYRQASSANR